MIRILAAAVRATVQDRGRFAHLRDGVPPSGPADPIAFEAAQALVGNDPSAAAIEIIGSQFGFSCDDRRIVAVTGRDVALRVRDRLPGWTTAFLRGGEDVTVLVSERTRFAYLAVSGGIAVETVLGSRATFIPAGLGRALRAGDELPLGAADVDATRAGRSLEPPEYQDQQVRAITGPHTERFTGEALDLFFTSQFAIDPVSDRMGARLDGHRLPVAGREILTCGVVAGAVQIPPSGLPIVLLADHQATGGYPVIASVITADVGRVAQRIPGEPLRFAKASTEEAVAALRAQRERFAVIA